MKYTAKAVVTLPAGTVLGLSEAQARDRKHALEPMATKGFYTTKQPAQFKVGEVFDYAGELPKALAEDMDAVERSKAQAAADAKAAAAALAEAQAAAEAAARASEAGAEAAGPGAEWSDRINEALPAAVADGTATP